MQVPRAGSSLGQYELVQAIGSGSMGVVFEARHRVLGRRVAVKILRDSDAGLPTDAVSSARFLREGRAAAQVTHPHVVDVFDYGVEDGIAYLVMEFVEGETLAQRLAREGALPLGMAIELLMPILSAVAELHAAGVIHRDLKPANILLARERGGEICPKVGDFGVSRLDDGTSVVTESNAVVGTYAYMSPEQARSARYTTERSDQYSLGVILYECVTGVRPFDASAPYELLHAITHGSFEPPSARNQALPPAFDAIMARAMAREPESRFAAIEELGEALLALASPRVASRWASEFRPSLSRIETSIDKGALAFTGSVSASSRRPLRASVVAIGALMLLGAAGLSIGVAETSRHVAPGRTAPLLAVAEPRPSVPALVASQPASARAEPAPEAARVPEAAPRGARSPDAHPAARPSHASRHPQAAAVGENGAPILEP